MRQLALLSCVVVLCACGDDDKTTHDAAVTADDGQVPDGGAADAAHDATIDAPAQDPDAGTPTVLSHEPLYANIATKTIASGMTEYAPAYALWSDGAAKRRWISIPAGRQIDTSDMDHWQFPVGTRFFKEFGFGGKPVETRMILKVSATSFLMGSFVWRADGSDADWMPGGLTTMVDGPGGPASQKYTVPSDTQCVTCHRGEPGKILGFSAIQLSKTTGPGPTLKSLASAGTLSNPPPAGTDYPVPGDAVTAAALGGLHANCGHCHNPNQTIFASIDQWLQLRTADRTPQTTTIYLSTVNKALTNWQVSPDPDGGVFGGHLRIRPMDPANSGIVQRMMARGSADQMPPRPFSYLVDQLDLDAVTAWVSTLTP